MANMAYCRFENTYSDLLDCYNAIEDRKELSESEEKYAEKMYRLCQNFIDEYENRMDELDEV